MEKNVLTATMIWKKVIFSAETIFIGVKKYAGLLQSVH